MNWMLYVAYQVQKCIVGNKESLIMIRFSEKETLF